MPQPRDLYELVGSTEGLTRPVLLHALPGAADPGSAARHAAAQLVSTLEGEVVARFDADTLVDSRENRPSIVFNEDHFEEYAPHTLELRRLRDTVGTEFLLLHGTEPSLHWEAFVAAVRELVVQLDVRLTVGILAIPMAVPHTRPLTLTNHATRPELLVQPSPWKGKMRLPASVASVLELRLGENGHDAVGFAVHVPHYLSEADYPAASAALLEQVTSATGLALPVGQLHQEAERVTAAVDEQIRGSSAVQEVVHGLEQQYDAFTGAAERRSLLAPDLPQVPEPEELDAELDRFLAELDRGGDDPQE